MTTSSDHQVHGLYHDLISAGECEQIVRNSLKVEEFVILGFKLTKIPGHLGFLGEYLHLNVEVEINGQRSSQRYFIKSLPLGDKNQREMMEEMGFFRKEVRVYSEILSKFGNNEGSSKWRPDCYYTRDDLIVLEDVKWRNGFTMVHYKTALDQPHLHLVLDAVAQMHACSLNHEYNLAGRRRLDESHKDVLFEASVSRDNGWFMAGLSGIRAIALNGTRYCKDTAKKELMEKELEGKLNRVFDIVKPTHQYQNVLVHRDIWLNNVMFQFNEDQSPTACVLLDFQICRYLPPIIDFLLTLYLTTRRSHRDEFFDRYLNFYHDQLATKLRTFKLDPQQILPKSQLETTLKEYRLIAHVFTGIYLGLTNLPANVLDDLHQNEPERYHRYCNENRDELMLRYLREDTFYRETMTECVEEMLEYLFEF
ncbi:uncharacterized protein LOC120418705 [Culex pipiens pallens]|uniref:uncharacterized protein LOC120418705 n=1 Tax=Culex pipiens pallens TaxID=42434 RepID=UPI001953D13E|nr:uncharacterized protein LOC120418705 [Culex pipiens pallens]